MISIHLPKTPETLGLIGKDQLALTKPGVHHRQRRPRRPHRRGRAGRGRRSGHVGGAGIDVYVTEPTTDSPLFELPQVVVTPHLGASTDEAQDRAGTDVARSVQLALAGEFVPDAVNVQVGGVGRRGGRALAAAGPEARHVLAALAGRVPSSVTVEVAASWPPRTSRPAAGGAARAVHRRHRRRGHVRERAGAGRGARRRPSSSPPRRRAPNYRSVVELRAAMADGAASPCPAR